MTVRESEIPVFNKGERVLCYEPDKTKARVLYNSKVLAVFERKDEFGLKYYDYKIHFQGWSPSYDRAVRASVLLKDSEENRQLQRELAEAAQLQKSGGNYYKGTPTQPLHKKKRLGRGGTVYVEDPLADPLDISKGYTDSSELPPTQRINVPAGGGSRSRDNSGGRKNQNHDKGDVKRKGTRSDAFARAEPHDSRSPKTQSRDTHMKEAQSLEPAEPRVIMRVSERLREYMEYDYNMVVKLGKQHAMPARMSIVTILENFVKQRAVELAIGIKQDSSRARNTQSRNARMEREFDRVMSNVCMLKEVVDGIRIYFEFLLDDELLYKEEKDYAQSYLTDDNLKNCSIMLNNSYDYINPSCDTELITLDGTPVVAGSGVNSTNGDGAILGGIEYEKQLQKCLLYIVKSSGKNIAQTYDQRTSPYTAAYKLPEEMRGFLCETFSWRLLSAESPPEKSMVFGAPHLARLMVKLPAYLNASSISNEKLEDLLPHLDSFINYLENHKEWFDKENYVHATVPQEQLQKVLLDSLDRRVYF